jgi:hypothetical protein
VRNRVAQAVARVSVVFALVPVALVTGVAVATASTADGVAASSMQFPVGPVGVAAVVVGLGGLVTGLVRHRRRGGPSHLVSKPNPEEQPAPDKAAA